jgi:large subunit ribosomal protein L29
VKAVDIRELSDDEIREKITESREELFRLRFRGATQQLENPALVKSLRREVARLLTILREREMEQ